jgi:hypothetical protein
MSAREKGCFLAISAENFHIEQQEGMDHHLKLDVKQY